MQLPKCDVCGKEVELKDGILSISFKDVRYVQEQEAEFKKKHPGPVLDVGEVMAFPDRVPWRWNHIGCSRDSSYDIEATRFDNLRKALHWTIHLQDKTWFRYTDWREVIHHLYPECDVENDKSR
jgi:hypothetical protein